MAMARTAKVDVAFNGTGIHWIGYSDPWSGTAHVYVDGKPAGSVDTYSATTAAQKTEFAVDNLAPGAHTFEIRVDQKKSRKSQGSWVWVDAFDVVQ